MKEETYQSELKCVSLEINGNNTEGMAKFELAVEGSTVPELISFKLKTRHMVMSTTLKKCKQARSNLVLWRNVHGLGNVILTHFSGKHCEHALKCRTKVCMTVREPSRRLYNNEDSITVVEVVNSIRKANRKLNKLPIL